LQRSLALDQTDDAKFFRTMKVKNGIKNEGNLKEKKEKNSKVQMVDVFGKVKTSHYLFHENAKRLVLMRYPTLF
jgi:hypothetical protein